MPITDVILIPLTDDAHYGRYCVPLTGDAHYGRYFGSPYGLPLTDDIRRYPWFPLRTSPYGRPLTGDIDVICTVNHNVRTGQKLSSVRNNVRTVNNNVIRILRPL